MKKEKQIVSSEAILDELDKKDIKQIPRWVFLLKNIGFWTLWAIFIVLGGSLTVSSVIYHVRFSGWEYYPVTHDSFGAFLIDAVPYVWIVLFIIFLVVGYENIRHTKRGYRYAFSGIVAVSLGVALFGGSLLSVVGAGRFVDDNLGPHVPFDHTPPGIDQTLWASESRGLLAGMVTYVDEENSQFTLELFNKESWLIDGTQLDEEDWGWVQEGGQVRIVGLPYEEGDEIFQSCIVLPWNPAMNGQGTGQGREKEVVPGGCQDCVAADEIDSCEDIPVLPGGLR